MDECRAGVNVCSENANCFNTEGSYSCTCRNGFIGNGITCLSTLISVHNYSMFITFYAVDNNDCGTLNCSQLCVNTTRSLTCACHPGFYLNTLNLRECEGT